MTLSFDGEPKVDHRRCDDCGGEHESAVGFVLRDGDAYAVYWAAWYPHENEAWIDVILGSWQEPDFPDNVTFGCRIGNVEGQEAPACSLVPAGKIRSDTAMFGRKLDRQAALNHPWLPAFWEVVDWLMLNDPTLHEHVFHMPPNDRL
jgi:hypothetical protein